MMYLLRFTNDLHIVAQHSDLNALKERALGSDYKLHIVADSARNTVIWQSSESVRYGSIGVEVR